MMDDDDEEEILPRLDLDSNQGRERSQRVAELRRWEADTAEQRRKGLEKGLRARRDALYNIQLEAYGKDFFNSMSFKSLIIL